VILHPASTSHKHFYHFIIEEQERKNVAASAAIKFLFSLIFSFIKGMLYIMRLGRPPDCSVGYI
jgi:hypothetical protein